MTIKKKRSRSSISGKFVDKETAKACPESTTTESIDHLTVYHIFKDENGEHRKEGKIVKGRVDLYGDEIAVEVEVN